jgi:hypothetical protein
VIVLTTGADVPAETVRLTAFETVPLEPFFIVTVKVPVARMAWPLICVPLPLAFVLQGVPQPGPVK